MTFILMKKLCVRRSFIARSLAFGLAFGAVSLHGFSAESQAPRQPDAQSMPTPAQAKIYTHPVQGYTIAIPPGAEVLEREGPNPQIAIRSRKGYKITLQAGTTRNKIPLQQLPAIMESTYLGKGKPWSRRLEDGFTEVAGIKAYQVIYEGANNRSKVIFVRGKQTDFVFVFISGLREYTKQLHEFDWVLESFRPVPDEIPKPKAGLMALSNVFTKPGYGYSLQYPAEWEQSEPSQMTVMFSGRVNTPAYSAIVSVQNVEPPGSKSADDALRLATQELKASLASTVPGAAYTADRPWTYRQEKFQLMGRELRVSYTHNGQKFRKLVFIVPRPSQAIVHVWSYTAPESDYKKFETIAGQMLKSWTILGQ